MKILIVDDDASLRETLAHVMKNEREGIEVLEAGTLDQARELLSQADAVLCDGSFPSHARSFEPEVTSNGNWAPVRIMAIKAGKPFVLLTGNAILVHRLRKAGTEAFAKPLEAFEAVRRVVRLAEDAELRRLDPEIDGR